MENDLLYGFDSDFVGAYAKSKIQEIGEALSQQGGIKLMRKVFTDFKRISYVFGLPGNLKPVWDGIGEWVSDIEKLESIKVETDKIT